jgi:hypothetical protein
MIIAEFVAPVDAPTWNQVYEMLPLRCSATVIAVNYHVRVGHCKKLNYSKIDA